MKLPSMLDLGAVQLCATSYDADLGAPLNDAYHAEVEKTGLPAPLNDVSQGRHMRHRCPTGETTASDGECFPKR